jgi:hypothetical protein
VRLPPISCAGMLPSGIYCICVKTSHRLVNIYRWHTLPSSAILTSDQWRIYMGAKGGPGPPTPKIFFKKNSNKNKIMLFILLICLVCPTLPPTICFEFLLCCLWIKVSIGDIFLGVFVMFLTMSNPLQLLQLGCCFHY